jgi:cytochrome c-type biogenesis protein CcmH/NrfG
MKKITFILFLVAVAGASLKAQNVDQGRRFFYYERFNSAKDQFEKIVASNPNNIDAVYWLGQTLIELDDSSAAKALYQKTLASNGNAPLLLVGTGQVELMENKGTDARQRFETAISLTKGRDINVFNAIARANVEAGPGDASYAIQKFTELGTQKKDIRNADSYLRMGEAYRKMVDGGAAVTAFQKALSIDPKLAEAKYEIGRVYLTQNNPEYFLPAFQEAIQLDPNYAPAYYQLFYYWYSRDINKATEFFNKYLAVADVKPSNEYDRISLLFAAKNYAAAIDSAKQKITQLGDQADPRYAKLVAYSYDAQNDSANAKTFLDQYFTKQKPEGFVPQDYVFRAKILSKFPGNEAEAAQNFEKAIEMDTSVTNKLTLMADAATAAGKAGDKAGQANWLGKIYATKTDPTNRDLYDWGYANYQAGNYASADSIFCGIYSTKYPTEIFGYLWCARSAQAQDTSGEAGTAVEPYKRLIAYADTAQEKYKAQLIAAHGYLASYYANVAKQKDSAIAQLEQILVLDPANADAPKYIEALKKPAARPASPKAPAKTTKPSATKPKRAA